LSRKKLYYYLPGQQTIATCDRKPMQCPDHNSRSVGTPWSQKAAFLQRRSGANLISQLFIETIRKAKRHYFSRKNAYYYLPGHSRRLQFATESQCNAQIIIADQLERHGTKRRHFHSADHAQTLSVSCSLRRYEKPKGIICSRKNAYYYLPGHSRRLQFATESRCNAQIRIADQLERHGAKRRHFYNADRAQTLAVSCPLRRYEKPKGIICSRKNAYYYLPGHIRRLQFATESQCNAQIIIADRLERHGAKRLHFYNADLAQTLSVSCSLRRYGKPKGIICSRKNAYYYLPGHSRRLQFATEGKCNAQIIIADQLERHGAKRRHFYNADRAQTLSVSCSLRRYEKPKGIMFSRKNE
jgi:ribosomal protein S16